jgi:acetate kinase
MGKAERMRILVLNSGSSSIKFSVYDNSRSLAGEVERLLDGELRGMGSGAAKLDVGGRMREVDAAELGEAIGLVLEAVSGVGFEHVEAVGHRVVHPGPKLRGHQRITPEVLRELKAAKRFAPLHDPAAITVIHAAMERFPDAAQFACFDTVFHETMPEEAAVYPLPEQVRAYGVRRYGFHGLSCESVLRQMRRVGALPRRMVIAHLGSGCSVTAVVDGASVDTTMGLTPTGGVVMGTRSGDLDPGVVLYLLRAQGAATVEAAGALEAMLNHDAGMAALSGMPNDVQAMRAAADGGDVQARLALKVFTRSVTKAIGGYCFLLGGLDAILFAGGIGEHDAATRGEVLAGLTEMGIVLDDCPVVVGGKVQRVSSSSSKTAVFVVPADEDHMIALHVLRMAQTD